MSENIQTNEASDLLKGKYLTFFLDEQCFGVEIRYVLEIIGVQNITKVPKVPSYISGIINLRGKVLPIIDMRLRFNKAFRPFDKKTCIIVVEVEEMTIGLIVDGVDEVENLPDTAISEPPQADWDYSSNFLKGVAKRGKEFQLILDCEKVLKD